MMHILRLVEHPEPPRRPAPTHINRTRTLSECAWVRTESRRASEVLPLANSTLGRATPEPPKLQEEPSSSSKILPTAQYAQAQGRPSHTLRVEITSHGGRHSSQRSPPTARPRAGPRSVGLSDTATRVSWKRC